MTKRNRWLKKQARKIQRRKEARRKYAAEWAKKMYDAQYTYNVEWMKFQSLLDYARGKQDVDKYKADLGIKVRPYEKPPTILPRA